MNKREGFRRIVTTITWAGIIGWSAFVLYVIDKDSIDGVLHIQPIAIITGAYILIIFGPIIFNLVLWIIDGFKGNNE